jgi:hypothetical protein
MRSGMCWSRQVNTIFPGIFESSDQVLKTCLHLSIPIGIEAELKKVGYSPNVTFRDALNVIAKNLSI